MLGFYDYTVILTYCSVISAVAGIIISLSGNGHPYIGVMFLMICGLCDTFDGRVARSKKNRTEKEKAFGVQIDSLSDLVAFGVLPVCIGMALYRRDIFEMLHDGIRSTPLSHIPYPIIILTSAIFVLCALIRLAYFNITAEETQSDALGDHKYYYGLPVTSTALIFPTLMLLKYCLCINISLVYYIVLIIVAILFVAKFKLKKPGNKMIYVMILIGAIEFILVLITRFKK